MTEVQGYTSDTGYVEDADVDDIDDGADDPVAEDYDPDGGAGPGKVEEPGKGSTEHPGLHQVDVNNSGGDPILGGGGNHMAREEPDVQITRDKDGYISKYATSDGRELQVVYGDNHEPIAIVDDKSGSKMIQTSEGWVLETGTGERVPVGDVSIDQQSGAISTTFEDGSSVTAWPNGKTVQKDSDGNITAVSRINGDGKFSVATARYDDAGNPVEIHDTLGSTYLNQNGQWVERHANGSYTLIDGDISLTEDGWTYSPRREDQGTPSSTPSGTPSGR